ncbi:MAG TPA: hypothetical protein VHB21_12940, partial [Minicystis sp.]|nr:hypothetical protein [Minicystis sp.]
PEGAIGALVACCALALGRTRRLGRPSALAAVPVAGAALLPAMHLVFAGHATSSTAIVKWLPLSPYVDAADLASTFLSNARLLLANLLDGGDWTQIFVPEGAAFVFVLGAVALVVRARRRRLGVLGASTLAVALGVLVPCSYMSFLWNRVRYVWPFVPALFVGVACLASEASELVRRFRPRLGFVGPALAGAFAGALATHVPWAVHDLAQSAAAIDKQQVALARWASANLAADARIGVNDTGAIAYLGGRPTFDVVGLTTEGEARYWTAGPGSRFEHYESMPRSRLPTHFIVYPQWMACPAVLGRALHEATVLDQSILGGTTMIAFEARWDALGTGAAPRRPPEGALLDALDVADLESEALHHYELGKTTDLDDLVATDPGPPAVTDGGRFHRTRDAFTLRFGAARTATLVLRVAAEEPLRLRVAVDGVEQGEIEIAAGLFQEASLAVRAQGETARVVVASRGGAEFASFHDWLYATK